MPFGKRAYHRLHESRHRSGIGNTRTVSRSIGAIGLMSSDCKPL
jgi:hypothetical protein